MGRHSVTASIRRRTLVAALALVLVLAACGGSDDEPSTTTSSSSMSSTTSTSTSTSTSTTTTVPEDPYDLRPEPGPEEPPAEGRYAVHVTAIDVAAGRLDVDVVQFLIGAEAQAAAAEDGEEATDFYIRNASDQIVILPVSDDVDVRLVRSGDPEPVPATLGEVEPGHRLYFVRLTGDEVTEIVEQYLP